MNKDRANCTNIIQSILQLTGRAMPQLSRRKNSFLCPLKALWPLGVWFFVFESGAVFSEAWPTSSLLTLTWADLNPKSYILCTEISKSLPLTHPVGKCLFLTFILLHHISPNSVGARQKTQAWWKEVSSKLFLMEKSTVRWWLPW